MDTHEIKYWFHQKWSNISYPFRKVYWFFLRGKNGWVPNDTWDLDSYLARVISESLKHLAETSNGWPCSNEFPTFESWKEYLLKLSKAFEDSVYYDDWTYNQYVQMYHDEGLNPPDSFEKINADSLGHEAWDKYHKLCQIEQDRIRDEMKKVFDNWRALWD